MIKVAPSIKFELIACGAEHSFGVAAETGDLYAWGLNFKGQLGLEDLENRSEPTLVTSMFQGDGPLNMLGISQDSASSLTRH